MNARVRPIHIGDFAPMVRLPNQRSKNVWAFDPHLAGQPVTYLILRDATSQAAKATLAVFKNNFTQFTDIGADVVVVSNLAPDGNAKLADYSGLPWIVLADPSGYYAASYGLPDGDNTVGCAVVDRNCRLLELVTGDTPAALAKRSLALCNEVISASSFDQIVTQAPVLLIPNVFEPRFCKNLIKYWEQGHKESDQITRHLGGTDGGAQSDLGNEKMKRRTDVLVPEGDHPVNLQIKQCLSMRVMPELEKAFNHKASRYELARVGCYESANKGFFRAHRDLYPGDTETPRRFAMSLNLNDGFEGGDVRFPEYGMQSYRAPLGGGLIFSCRLLHEALPVTKGKRYALFLFFN
jgi:peroxiredoxin